VLTAPSRGAGLVARIGETEIANHDTPRRVHGASRTKALLLCDFGGWLQYRHLERGDRETRSLILRDLLGSSRARSCEDDNCCSQGCRSHNQDLLFQWIAPFVGSELSTFNMEADIPIIGV
jgi:hypothetical protein